MVVRGPGVQVAAAPDDPGGVRRSELLVGDRLDGVVGRAFAGRSRN